MVLAVAGTSLMDVWSNGGLLELIEDNAANQTLFEECCCGCVCNCPYLVNKWNSADTLAIHFDFPSSCGIDFDGSLFPGVGTPPAGKTSCFHWGNTFTTVEFGQFEVVVWCDGDTVGMSVSSTTTGNCSFGATEVNSFTCDPFEISASSIVTSESGAEPDPCTCTGETVAITVT